MKSQITTPLSPRVLCSAAVLSAQTPVVTPATGQTDRDAEIRDIRQELKVISDRLEPLEAEGSQPAASGATSAAVSGSPSATPQTPAAEAPVVTPADAPALSFFRGTTLNFGIGGYYGYNFNAPVGRVNLLRAYDITSNSFSLNQVNVVVEHLPTTESRFGGHVDLQFCQATETLQGSGANEQRPQMWRNLFQACGSYLAQTTATLGLMYWWGTQQASW